MARDALVHCGKINAAATKSGVQHNDDYAVHLTRLGEASERLDARQMRALTGSDYYLGRVVHAGHRCFAARSIYAGVQGWSVS